MNNTQNIVEWSDQEWETFKNWLEYLLHNDTIELVFTKLDGTVRVMQATKNSTVITEELNRKEQEKAQSSDTQVKTEKRKKSVSKDFKDNLLVWDVEINDWRMVKIRNLTNILTLILKHDYNTHLKGLSF
jgi:hypothetical protein